MFVPNYCPRIVITFFKTGEAAWGEIENIFGKRCRGVYVKGKVDDWFELGKRYVTVWIPVFSHGGT